MLRYRVCSLSAATSIQAVAYVAKVVVDTGRYSPSASWSSIRRLNASASGRVSPALRLYCRPPWSRQV